MGSLGPQGKAPQERPRVPQGAEGGGGGGVEEAEAVAVAAEVRGIPRGKSPRGSGGGGGGGGDDDARGGGLIRGILVASGLERLSGKGGGVREGDDEK